MNSPSVRLRLARKFPAVPRSMLDLVRLASAKTVSGALILAAIAWFPLAVLSAFRGWLPLKSYLTDFAAQSRWLIVVPLMILAEPPLRARLEFVARHFPDERLIAEEDSARFEKALSASEALRDSKIVKILILVLIYLFTLGWLMPFMPHDSLMLWSVTDATRANLSAAGTYSALVSYPILLYLLFLWLWRQGLWTWFLARVCRLGLRMVAAHPDHCGGVGFVRNYLQGQIPYSFAIGTIVAGGVANRIIHLGQNPLDFKPVFVALVILVLLFFIGPLCTFMKALLGLKRRGTVEYGALACALGHQFEAKWLERSHESEPEILEVPDFSATIDLYSIIANVHELRPFPIGIRDLTTITVAALIPSIPVAFAVVPFDVILKEILKLVM